MPGTPNERALEEKLGIAFADGGLLRQALVHPSYTNENPGYPSNERLEFLGDALLDFLVAERLYGDYPNVSEGGLTSLRAALVNGETLNRVAARMGLGEHLYLGQGEEATGGKERPSNLAAALEALIGALYLDRGIDFVGEWVNGLLAEEMTQLKAEGIPKDAKSRLQERVQAVALPSPEYRLVRERGPGHARQFVVEVVVGGRVMGRGEGRRKTEAEKVAAQVALKRLDREKRRVAQTSAS